MPGTKISELPAASALTGTEDVPIVQDGETRRTTAEAVSQAAAWSFAPVGAIIAFGGPVVPDGWLECDGAEVSRADFADLFEVIGETWGPGDGVSTYNVPRLAGCALIGTGDGGFATIALGEFGGSPTNSQNITTMAGHNHQVNGELSPPVLEDAGGIQLNVLASASGGANQVTEFTGESGPFSIMQPWAGVLFLIRWRPERVPSGGGTTWSGALILSPSFELAAGTGALVVFEDALADTDNYWNGGPQTDFILPGGFAYVITVNITVDAYIGPATLTVQLQSSAFDPPARCMLDWPDVEIDRSESMSCVHPAGGTISVGVTLGSATAEPMTMRVQLGITRQGALPP